jgi:hypothetical protein
MKIVFILICLFIIIHFVPSKCLSNDKELGVGIFTGFNILNPDFSDMSFCSSFFGNGNGYMGQIYYQPRSKSSAKFDKVQISFSYGSTIYQLDKKKIEEDIGVNPAPVIIGGKAVLNRYLFNVIDENSLYKHIIYYGIQWGVGYSTINVEKTTIISEDVKLYQPAYNKGIVTLSISTLLEVPLIWNISFIPKINLVFHYSLTPIITSNFGLQYHYDF